MRILADHKTFDSVTDLNEAIRQHLYANQFALNTTAVKILEVVSRHAVKYAGASWLKADTLAAMLGVSTKTVRRGLAKLQTLGIIEKRTTLRKITGGHGANIIVVLPASVQASVSRRPISVEPTESKAQPVSQPAESISSLQKPFKSDSRTLQAPSPSSFYEHLQTLIKDRRERREYYIAFKKQVASLLRFDLYADQAELLDAIAVRSLYTALRRQQTGTVGNSVGYFYGTLRNQIDAALFKDMSEVYSASPDELLASLPY